MTKKHDIRVRDFPLVSSVRISRLQANLNQAAEAYSKLSLEMHSMIVRLITQLYLYIYIYIDNMMSE